MNDVAEGCFLPNKYPARPLLPNLTDMSDNSLRWRFTFVVGNSSLDGRWYSHWQRSRSPHLQLPWCVPVDQQSTDTLDNTINPGHHVHAIAYVYWRDDNQKAIQLSLLSGQASYELAKKLNDADSYRYDVVVKMLSEHFDSLFVQVPWQVATPPWGCGFVYGCTELIVPGWIRQELTCEQFVRGQMDHELHKHDERTVIP